MGLPQVDRPAALSCRTLRPWFVPFDGDRDVRSQCVCECAWTRILAALQETGPVALVLPIGIPATEAPAVLAAGLALGRDWTLHAVVTRDGVDESLRWLGAGQPMEVHALPSSNWRPFDRLARMQQQHGAAGTNPLRHDAHPAAAMPLLVDADFRLRLLRWSALTQLDQDQGYQWMRRRNLRVLQA
mgnify:CR=1 FL=1